MEESISIIQQISDIIGVGSTGSVIDDIFGYFFLLVVTLVCFNLIFTFISVFFRRN